MGRTTALTRAIKGFDSVLLADINFALKCSEFYQNILFVFQCFNVVNVVFSEMNLP